MPKAVFLDRDGTINKQVDGYPTEISQIEWLPRSLDALRMLSSSTYKIIIITNQSAVGRGMLTKERLNEIHDWMMEQFSSEGIKIDGIYFCPHLPEDNCECRKPKPGMIVQAANNMGIDLSQSFMVGDNERDIGAGKAAGCKTIFVGGENPEADYSVGDLYGAVEIILGGEAVEAIPGRAKAEPQQETSEA